MKIFISQKMRDKTEREIWLERENIKGHWVKEHIDEDLSDLVFIESYRPELAYKDPITSLSQSLAMLAEADIVLVPTSSYANVHVFANYDTGILDAFYCNSVDYEKLRGCEFEFLIAKSYGKKVYTYDEHFQLTPLV